jgi:hypothetical protein
MKTHKKAAPARGKGEKVAAGRIKGETTTPTNTLALVQKIGVTRASKELGVSTTTLHKARKSNVVSKVVEIAATFALEHLGDTPRSASLALPPSMPMAPVMSADGTTTLFLLEVSADKAAMVQKFAQHLGAKLMAA